MEPELSTSLQELAERVRMAGAAEVARGEALVEILELLGHCAESLKTSQQELKARQARWDEIVSERDALAQRVADLEAGLGELDGLRSRIAELEQVAAERDVLALKVEALQAAADEAEALRQRIVELEQAAAERDVLALKVESLQAAADEAEALRQRIAELESTLQHTVSERDTLSAKAQEVDRLASEVDSLRTRIAELEAPAARVPDLEAELERLRVDALRVESLEKALEEARARAADAEQARAEADAATRRVQEIEESLNKAELERKILLDQLSGLNKQLDRSDELSRRVSELEATLEQEREEKAQLQAQVAALRNRAEEPATGLSGPRPVISARQATDSGYTRQEPVKAAPRVAPPAPTPQLAVRPTRGKGRGKRQFGELLIEAGIITQEQLDEAMRIQAADPRKRLGTIIVELGFATEEVIAATLAAQLRLRFVEKLEREMRSDAMRMVPPTLVLNHRVIPLFFESMTLTVAMANPMDLIALEDLEHATGVRIQPVVATATAIEDIIDRYYLRAQT